MQITQYNNFSETVQAWQIYKHATMEGGSKL